MSKALVILAVVLSVSMCGCGEDGEETTKVGDVEVNRRDGKIEVTGPDGTKAVFGPVVPLPEDFPKDVHVYEGATVVQATKQPRGFSITLVSKDSAQSILDTYDEKLKADGWTAGSSTTVAAGAMRHYTKGKRRAVLTLSTREAGQTTMNLAVLTQK